MNLSKFISIDIDELNQVLCRGQFLFRPLKMRIDSTRGDVEDCSRFITAELRFLPKRVYMGLFVTNTEG